jgi:hypothetical protein
VFGAILDCDRTNQLTFIAESHFLEVRYTALGLMTQIWHLAHHLNRSHFSKHITSFRQWELPAVTGPLEEQRQRT